MRNIRLATVVLLSLVAVFVAPTAVQAQTASITGTVNDATGAMVPSAKVTARNTETNSARSTQTTDTGTYRITNLMPGIYEVLFEKQGFQTLRFSRVSLTVDQVLTLDAKVEVSAVSQTMEVNAQSMAPVELENAQISNVVDSRRITELPLIVRDPYQLILLSPGVIQSNSGLGGFSVNGQRERNNNFLLDGVDNNDTEVPGIAGGITSLNPDATQEFRVITTNFLPEFGRNTGAIIDIVTKSGTNHLHGNAYWFGRYTALAARDFFNHNLDSTTGTIEPQAPFVRNDFGASAGGPIRKDKTFWFSNYEGQRFVTTLINTSTLPAPAFKSGLFTFGAKTVDVRTPSSPNNAAGFPLDPTIQRILALYPTPNAGAVDDIRSQFHFGSASRQRTDNATVKIDHNFTTNHRLSGRYVFNRFVDPNPFHTDFLPGLDSISTFQRTQNLSANFTSNFGPAIINELRLGGNRTNLQFGCNGISTFNSFGPLDPFKRGRDYNLPSISGFGCFSLGDSNGQARFTGTYTTADALTYLHGKHTYKSGFEFRKVYSNSFDDFSARAALEFDVFSLFGPGNASINLDPANPCVGNEPADLFRARCGSTVLQNMGWMLFGTVSSHSQTQFFDKSGVRAGDDLRGFRQREVRVFVQDSWKAAPHLTVNYGLAWAFYGVPFEVNDNLSTLFADPTGLAPFTFSIVGRAKGARLYHNYSKNWEPGVGIAWDPFKKGKTVIRTGYGISHDRTFGNLFGNARGNPPFQVGFQDFPGDILPNIALPPALKASAVVNQGDGFTPIIFDQNFRNPVTQSWTLDVQHELLRNVTLDVAYVGNHSTHAFRQLDGNPPQPALVAALEAFCVPTNPNNVRGGPFNLSRPCTQATLQGINLWFGKEFGRLPFDAVNNNAFFQAFLQRSIANSIYHGLQVKVTKQMSHGFQIQGAYTYSHSIDDASDPLVPAAGNRTFPRNSLNLRPERGNSDFDIRHRLVINYIYEFPLGRNRSYLQDGVLGRVLEGWQISGITTFSGGLPFDIFGNRDSQHTGVSDRANLIGDPRQPSGVDKTFTGPNVAAFALTPFGRASNLTRNQFYGPGLNHFDLVIMKTTSITERLKLDLRSEFYNIFNRTEFTQPGNNIANPGTFGQSTSELGRADGTSGARQIQFALKLNF